jgi:hypothetical protein
MWLVVLVLCLVLGVSGQPPQSAKCISSGTGPYSSIDWSLAGGYYFTFFNSSQKRRYDSALAFCQNLSAKASLATPGSDEEWQTVINLASGNTFLVGMKQLNSTQNGGPVAEPEGSYYWSNGSLVDWGDDVLLANVKTISFTDEVINSTNENCIRYSPGGIRDISCASSYAFHCALRGIPSFQSRFQLTDARVVQDCYQGSSCTPGSFQSSNMSCLVCPSGTYSNILNATSCTPCVPGTYSSRNGSSFCGTCPKHSYSSDHGSINCSNCPQAMISPEGSTSISDCSLQTCAEFSFPSGARRGFSFNVNFGFTYHQSKDWCQSQAKGSQLAILNNTSLVPFITAMNAYTNNDAWIDGSKYPIAGSRNYTFSTGERLDEATAPMLISDDDNQLCLRFSDSYHLIDTDCLKSLSYHICEIDLSYCGLICSPGQFFSSLNSSCESCSPGTFSASSGATNCDVCVSGRFSSILGATHCPKCPIGQFSDSLNSTSCTSCGQNTLTTSTGSSFLENCFCSYGYFGKPFKGEHCTPCFDESELCDYNESSPFVNSGYWLAAPQSRDYFKCIPEESCASTGYGNSTTCSEGYTGLRCGNCVTKLFYRFNQHCKPCGNDALKWIVFVIFVLIIAYGLIRVANLDKSAIPYDVRVAYSWIQLICLFPVMFENWPKLLNAVLQSLSFLSIDLSFTSPGRINQSRLSLNCT